LTEDQVRHGAGRLLVHPGDDVGVDLQGKGRGRVAESLADDLRGDAGLEGRGRIGVTHVVKPDAGEPRRLTVLMEESGDGVGVQWLAIRPHEQQRAGLTECSLLLLPERDVAAQRLPGNGVPAAGEMVFFDRSWYNRAGVERVMGFVTDDEYEQFMAQAPLFERMIVDSGIHLTKLWFSVTQSEQRTRFIIRQVDPVRQWKLSPMDLQSLDKWDAYTSAKEEMFLRTDTDFAPWTTVKSNDKKRARLNAMRYFLSRFDYEDKDPHVVGRSDPLIVARGRDAIGD
jgi:hypothetical protein